MVLRGGTNGWTEERWGQNFSPHYRTLFPIEAAAQKLHILFVRRDTLSQGVAAQKEKIIMNNKRNTILKIRENRLSSYLFFAVFIVVNLPN